MNRREFLKKSAMAGLGGIGMARSLGSTSAASSSVGNSEIIVAQGGKPDGLLSAALKAYGGLEKIIKPGSTVIVKANFSWWRSAEEAANTNPDLLAALVRACKGAGAKRVRVVDISIDYYKMCLDKSGIKKAVEKAGGEVENYSYNSPRTKLSTGVLDLIKDFSICTEALEADCLINVPILKHHRVTQMTGALKNYLGLTHDRASMHSVNIHRAIVDLAKLVKPHLHIIDAYRVMKTRGPQGPGEIADLKQLIVTHDPVAGDAYGASLLNLEPGYLKMAAEAGLGCADLNKIVIKKVKV